MNSPYIMSAKESRKYAIDLAKMAEYSEDGFLIKWLKKCSDLEIQQHLEDLRTSNDQGKSGYKAEN